MATKKRARGNQSGKTATSEAAVRKMVASKSGKHLTKSGKPVSKSLKPLTRSTKSAPKSAKPPFEQVYDIVKKIPRGKVLTYGDISKKLNGRLSAAAVGWALNGLGSEKAKAKGYDSKTVPWHRVLNSKGKVSTREESPLEGCDGSTVTMQQFMLEREGVEFEHDGSLDLAKYLWTPNTRA